MIYLICKSLPDCINTDRLYKDVLSAFAQSEPNFNYITKLYKKSNTESAAESLYSLLLMSKMLDRAYPSWRITNAELCRGEYGKPYFDKINIHFNISHSHGVVAVAISDESAVGIDIENSDISTDRAQRLAERFFTENEQKITMASPHNFLSVWRQKEATAKYLGMPLGNLFNMAKDEPEKYQALTDRLWLREAETPCGTVTLCTDLSESEIRIINI